MAEKRYKVLAADDEFWTREKLKHMIEWDTYSLEFLEPAKDGAEVLERMEQEKPDILITDINMPFVNGAELISKLHEKYPDVVTFVISGYDNFEYVKSAFMSGAVNYLLKPVTKITLVNALVKALEIISERENEQMQLLKAASLIQDREFSRLVKGEEFYTMELPADSMDSAGASLMLIKIHNLHEMIEKNNHDMNLFSYNIKKEISRILGKEGTVVFNHIYRSNEFIVIAEMGVQEFVQAAGQIEQFFSRFPDTFLTFCISGHSYSMDSIYRAYIEAVALLMRRRFCKNNEIVPPSEETAHSKSGMVNTRMDHEQEKMVKHYLAAGNAKSLMQVIVEEIGLGCCEKEKWNYIEVWQTVKQITNIFTEETMKLYGNKGAVDFENLAESADRAVEYLDAPAVCDAMEEMVAYLLPDEKEVSTGTIKDIVRKAAEYVDNHYSENISLVSLAGMFNVEHSYFSKLFRQEMGENMTLYLTKKRMEQAKLYMKKHEISLTEIAFMVGYDDYTYFSRVFKKNTGMSPREYKNRCKEGSE